MSKQENSTIVQSTAPIESSLLENIKILSQLTYQSIYVVDYTSNKALYSSNDQLPVFQKDQELLYEISEAWRAKLKTLRTKEDKTYFVSYQIHHTEDTEEILFNHKLSPLKFDQEGNVTQAVCLVSLPSYKDAGHVILRHSSTNNCWVYSTKRHKWRLFPQTKLSSREKQILHLSAQGYTEQEIAEKENLKICTVKSYKQALFQKLEAKNNLEAILIATNYNLL